VDERARRIAENEAMFRDLNEEVGTVAHSFVAAGEQASFDFLCECADPVCIERVQLPLQAYERVRANPIAFFVVPGHEVEGVERVAEDHSYYRVVEKTGESARIARERDPRS
jgi:hypothetical protein